MVFLAGTILDTLVQTGAAAGGTDAGAVSFTGSATLREPA